MVESIQDRIELLRSFLTPERSTRVQSVIDQRISNLSIILDGAHDPMNISAVIRTSEGMGLKDLFLIGKAAESRRVNGISRSAERWVDLHRFTSPEQAAKDLKGRGIKWWVFDLDGEDIESALENDVPERLGLVIGAEKFGISPELKRDAHRVIRLPLIGFVQSYNLSVSAAMALSYCLNRSPKNLFQRQPLSENQKLELEERYLELSIERDPILRKVMIEEARKRRQQS